MIVRLQDNPYIIVKPESYPITVTGATFYNFIASGETVITQVQTGNLVDVTIYNPSGSSTSWGLIVGDITNQTDLTDYVAAQISASTSGLTSSWSGLTGLPSDNVDLNAILTGMTADIQANTQCCTGNTADIDYHYQQFTGFTDYFATLIIPAITGNTQDISDLSGAFDSHSGNTLIHFEKTDISYNDLQDLPTLFSGDYDDLTNKPDLSIYLTGYTVTADDVTGITASLYAPIIHTHPYSGLTGLPTLFSGDYDDLTNKPDLSVYQPVSGMSAYLTGVTWNDVTNKPDLTLQSDFTGHTSDLTIHFVQSGISITESQISDLQAYTLTGTTQALSDAFDTYTGTTAPASFLPITGLTGYWTSAQTENYVTGYTPTLEWGNITGTISGQTDLWGYISGTTGGEWGTITGDITGQTDLVVYVSTAISAATSGMTTSLSGLTDTTITSPQDFNVLMYDTGTWTNSDSSQDIFEYVAEGEMLRRNGTDIIGIPYSVMTGATGAQGIQGESGLTPTLIFTGSSVINYDADYTSTGVTYTIGISGETGASGLTPTLVFSGVSGTTIDYTQSGATYYIGITGAQGIQGGAGSGATILISSGATIATYISGSTTGNTWNVYSPDYDYVTINNITGTSYTTVSGDCNEIIECASGCTGVTLHSGATTGFQITFVNLGGQTITFSAETGSTLRSKDSAVTLVNQYGAVTAYKNNTYWTLIGDLE